MAIGGQKKKQEEFQKSVGVFEANVLAFNPSREKLEELLNTTIEKDPEYFTDEHEVKDENGTVIGKCKMLIISAWLEDVKTKQKFNVRFYLIDRNRKNQAGDKFQYINSHGVTSWAKNTEEFEQEKYSWFAEAAPIRVAKVGEEELYTFLRAWLLIDFKNDPEAELSLSWDRLMNNNITELTDAMNSDLAGTVLCLATIRSADGDNGPVEYQSVYNRKFLPGSYMRSFLTRGRKQPKALEKFVKEITDAEYGCPDYYVMEPLKAYTPETNVAVSDAVHIHQDVADSTADDITF